MGGGPGVRHVRFRNLERTNPAGGHGGHACSGTRRRCALVRGLASARVVRIVARNRCFVGWGRVHRRPRVLGFDEGRVRHHALPRFLRRVRGCVYDEAPRRLRPRRDPRPWRRPARRARPSHPESPRSSAHPAKTAEARATPATRSEPKTAPCDALLRVKCKNSSSLAQRRQRFGPAAFGRLTRKHAPRPGRLQTDSSAPICKAYSLHRASPSPVPPFPRRVVKNGSKIRSCN